MRFQGPFHLRHPRNANSAESDRSPASWVDGFACWADRSASLLLMPISAFSNSFRSRSYSFSSERFTTLGMIRHQIPMMMSNRRRSKTGRCYLHPFIRQKRTNFPKYLRKPEAIPAV